MLRRSSTTLLGSPRWSLGLVAATSVALLLSACSDDAAVPAATSAPEANTSAPAEAPVIPDELRPEYDYRAARAIVAALGVEIATYYVDGTGRVDVIRDSNVLQLTDESLSPILDAYELTPHETHFVSNGVVYAGGDEWQGWCVSISNPNAPDGYPDTYSYSAQLGILEEPCPGA